MSETIFWWKFAEIFSNFENMDVAVEMLGFKCVSRPLSKQYLKWLRMRRLLLYQHEPLWCDQLQAGTFAVWVCFFCCCCCFGYTSIYAYWLCACSVVLSKRWSGANRNRIALTTYESYLRSLHLIVVDIVVVVVFFHFIVATLANSYTLFQRDLCLWLRMWCFHFEYFSLPQRSFFTPHFTNKKIKKKNTETQIINTRIESIANARNNLGWYERLILVLSHKSDVDKR